MAIERTAGEDQEALAKRQEHQKGLQEAKFYSFFLDEFKTLILKKLESDDVLGDKTLLQRRVKKSVYENTDKSGTVGGHHQEKEVNEDLTIREVVDKLRVEANRKAGTDIPFVEIDENILKGMNREQLIEYFDRLKSSLLKT